MAKDYTCWDCGYYGGRHEPTCPKKGYLMPSAPKAPAAPEPARVECPCGIHREDCDYHRPSAEPPKPYEYGAYDVAPTPAWHSVVSGPGVYVYDASGALIEMPIGSILSPCIRGTVKA